jgi:hypothetical protein
LSVDVFMTTFYLRVSAVKQLMIRAPITVLHLPRGLG